MEDNLESGWVSVRPKVFDEKERHKFVFIVAWNDIEEKFAITCHNRTVQRRSTLLDLDGSPTAAFPAADAEKQAKSPTKAKGVSQAGKVRPRSVSKGKNTADAGVGDKNATQDFGLNTFECVSHTFGSWDVVTPKAVELEILDPAEVPPAPDEADPADVDAGGREDFSWAGLFSFQDLRTVHQQLCAVNSDLEPCLPPFPEEQSGVWTVLFGGPGFSQRETEALCYQLQVYLGHALDTCGWRILSQVLFSESDDTEEYYESLSELRQKGYEDALEAAKRRMQEVLDKHKAMDSMVELLQVYPEEDEAYGDLLEASTQLYHYLLQPFRDIRELATLRRQQIKISLETERLGPRRVESLRREDEEWQKKAHAAVLSIQELTVKFFETTTRAQKASSPMDEVLASLKRGSFHLRKAELRVLGPDPDDDTNNILAQIRQGVRLKKVGAGPEQPPRPPRGFPHSADALTRSIHEALRRIKEASPESESEDEGLPCTDWES
ncbi:unnamed protein product [Menidia menidia]|uniref:(Atlantic silverside) hypothetical protein n=1 Tax=Menidia menidia TaxID=238744 RepID=A0A8S4ATW9_9TELE|nr:unnamed protein product [Menidia menidia]